MRILFFADNPFNLFLPVTVHNPANINEIITFNFSQYVLLANNECNNRYAFIRINTAISTLLWLEYTYTRGFYHS